jgi:hypothetical protein
LALSSFLFLFINLYFIYVFGIIESCTHLYWFFFLNLPSLLGVFNLFIYFSYYFLSLSFCLSFFLLSFLLPFFLLLCLI